MITDNAPPSQSDTYRKYIYKTVLIRRTLLRVKNEEKRMWGLVAKRDIQAGEFIGIYTGSYDTSICPQDSHYSLDMGSSQPCILPFADESNITTPEREKHPLACINEPSAGTHANCHMAIQDFSHDEIENLEAIPDHHRVNFFRCMCCFACEHIRSGAYLTWNYGPAYQPIRVLVGYAAGFSCRQVLDNEVFIKKDSAAALEALGGRVPHYAVWGISQKQSVKSARFKRPKKRRVDSDGEVSDSFSSGSGYEEKYKPKSKRKK